MAIPNEAHQDRGVSTFINKLSSTLKRKKKKGKEKEKETSPVARSFCSQSNEFDCVFRYFDENGDGKISPEELRDCMNVIREEVSLEVAEEIVRSADSDGDGLLGFDDFVALVDVKEEEEKGRSLKEAFEMYEMKGEGCITAKSLRRALRELGDLRSLKECEVMIRKFDENGDGVISFDEFRNMMMM